MCSYDPTVNSKSLFLITFGSGSDRYSTKSPSYFNFTANYKQSSSLKISVGEFDFVSAAPSFNMLWHSGVLDHTSNDRDGYVYVIDIDNEKPVIFQTVVHNLTQGVLYNFSSYLANVSKKNSWPLSAGALPKIRFEARPAATLDELIEQSITDFIPESDTMNWLKHDLLFVAKTKSVMLLMRSCVEETFGNDIAIDDIELRVCANDISQQNYPS